MFESHITVKYIDDDHFKRVCKKLGVKPVIIENDSASAERQLMTSKFHHTDDQALALQQMDRLADQLSLVSAPVRRKLELILGKRSPPDEYLYLEYHLKYKVAFGRDHEFSSLVQQCGGHTATNVVKLSDYQFATARDELTYLRIRGCLLDKFQRVSIIRECVVFDDNPSIDAGWCGAACGACKLKEVD